MGCLPLHFLKATSPPYLLWAFLLLSPLLCPVGFVRAGTTGDPCAVLSKTLEGYYNSYPKEANFGLVWARPSEVAPCSRSVPYNEIRDNGTLESIIRLFQNHYPLIHIAKNSPEPRLPSNYDVIAALRQIQSKKWTTYVDFYEAVINAVHLLNDGHTGFVPNCPPFSYYLPLELSFVRNPKGPQVVVPPRTSFSVRITSAALQAPFFFNASQYAEATVLKINGKEAWKYMVNFSQSTAGIFHNPSQKLNNAFSTITQYNGSIYKDLGTFVGPFLPPKTDYVTLTLQKKGSQSNETVQVPWLAYTDASFIQIANTSKNYYLSLCDHYVPAGVSRTDSKGSSEAAHRLAFPNLFKVGRVRDSRPQFLRHVPQEEKASAAVSKSGVQISGPGDFFMVYKLADKKTCAIYIHTFYSDTEAYAFLDMFVNEALKAFRTANASCSQVIIDVSNNRAGYSVLAPWLVEILVGSKVFPQPIYRGEEGNQFLADEEFVLGMVNNSLGDFNAVSNLYADITNVRYVSQNQFFYPTMKLRFGRNGTLGTYSKLFCTGNPTAAQWVGVPGFPAAFGAKPFALLSNGFCYSTCSSFTHFLKIAAPRTQFVAIGGFLGQDMAVSAAGGGFVTFDIVQEIVPTTNFFVSQYPTSPAGFGVQASLPMRGVNGLARLPGDNYYTFNYSAPIEFVFQGVDLRIPYTLGNIGDVLAQYSDAAKAAFK
jgi:hypothetical protein